MQQGRIHISILMCVCFMSAVVYFCCLRSVADDSLITVKSVDGIYRTIILPVVLYGCETWSLALRKEIRLRVFENRVLRRVFGPKRDEVTGEWRKLHNEELSICTPYPILFGW